MTIPLSNPYTERDAVRAPHFFNGRLLSAEDMLEDRRAARRLLTQLGRAVGDGIAYGLEVTGAIGGSSATDPVVTVSAGLAINRDGRPIELNQSVDVSLKDPGNAGAAPSSGATQKNGAFGICGALSTSAYAAGKGVYLLTIAPTETREGTAPASGLGKLTVCCGQKSVVDAVQFRLIRLDVSASDLNDARLRNRIAHRCFGTTDARKSSMVANLFGPMPTGYGAIDDLRDGRLTDSEVPLALVHWAAGAAGGTNSGIRFIDAWAVRRRFSSRPQGDSDAHPSEVLSTRRKQEAYASYCQFQSQVADTMALGPVESVKATDSFSYLPAAGVLPLSGIGASRGFDRLTFLQGLTWSGPAVIEGALLEPLLRQSLTYGPIDVTSKELVWTYLVRENLQGTSSGAQPYFVFTTGQMPYWGNARLDVSKASFSNVSLI